MEKFATDIRFWVWMSFCCGAVCVPHHWLIHSICLTFNMLFCAASLVLLVNVRIPSFSLFPCLSLTWAEFHVSVLYALCVCVCVCYRTYTIWFRWDNNQFGWCKANQEYNICVCSKKKEWAHIRPSSLILLFSPSVGNIGACCMRFVCVCVHLLYALTVWKSAPIWPNKKPKTGFELHIHTCAFASMCVYAWLYCAMKSTKQQQLVVFYFISISLVHAFQSISFCIRETNWQFNMEEAINRPSIVYTLNLCIAVNNALPSSICLSLSLFIVDKYKKLFLSMWRNNREG